MHEVILEHPTHNANGYYWYIARALQRLQDAGQIDLVYVATDYDDDTPDDIVRYVRTCWIDEVPRIIDLRDTHRLPLTLMDELPEALVLKANIPLAYWRGSSDVDFSRYRGMDATDEERDIILGSDRVRAFAFGRAIAAPFDANLREALRPELQEPRPYRVACLVGAGQTWQQTHYRLQLLEFLDDLFGEKARLGFFRPERCTQQSLVPEFRQRAKRFELPAREVEQVRALKGYYRWLAGAEVAVNVPGFCLSQPFRFVDGVLAGVPSVTTRLWSAAYRSFPAPKLPFCAFTGHGAWKWTLERVLTAEGRAEVLELQTAWYDRWLSPQGVFDQLIGGIL